jgi:hypothetical protein
MKSTEEELETCRAQKKNYKYVERRRSTGKDVEHRRSTGKNVEHRRRIGNMWSTEEEF